MKNELFRGFDSFKPDKTLVEKTTRLMLKEGAENAENAAKAEKNRSIFNKIGRAPRWAYAAACAVLAVALTFGILAATTDRADFNTAERNVADGSEEMYEMSSDEESVTWSEDALISPGMTGEDVPDVPIEGDFRQGEVNTDGRQTQMPAGVLTARYHNDNQSFSEWASLLRQGGEFSHFANRWGIHLTNRVVVNVRNGQMPVRAARVELLPQREDANPLWSAVTDNLGRAFLFYNTGPRRQPSPQRVRVSLGRTVVYADLEQSHSGEIGESGEISVDISANSPENALDLMFVVDTTGSMGDELSYIQTELEDIIRRVQSEQERALRLSVNFYRDEGDEYVVRSFPFTTNINRALRNLRAQSAEGGGDFPEAVDAALQNAIHEQEWESGSTRLLFLVLDAPPHNHAAENIRRLTRDAARKGIRIIPITCSGIDKNTEFLTRSLSVATGGTYVTLTGDSGVGQGHIDPSIGESSVYQLNDLIVRIIQGYMVCRFGS